MKYAVCDAGLCFLSYLRWNLFRYGTVSKVCLVEGTSMKRRRTREGRQVNALQDLGVGQDVPIADFSDQPDSGGRIGGVRGLDEFGIEGGVAAEWGREALSQGTGTERLLDATQAGIESSEDFSIEGEEESQAIAEVLAEGEQAEVQSEELPKDLRALIEYRLRNHDRIDARNVSVRIESPGLVVLKGRVRTESESLRVSEVVSALPGVYVVRNQLAVPR
jgi:hypothetical protein